MKIHKIEQRNPFLSRIARGEIVKTILTTTNTFSSPLTYTCITCLFTKVGEYEGWSKYVRILKQHYVIMNNRPIITKLDKSNHCVEGADKPRFSTGIGGLEHLQLEPCLNPDNI